MAAWGGPTCYRQLSHAVCMEIRESTHLHIPHNTTGTLMEILYSIGRHTITQICVPHHLAIKTRYDGELDPFTRRGDILAELFTPTQAAQHCSSAAVWSGVILHVPVSIAQ